MPRKLPLLTPETRPFWTGGADERLLICRCGSCDRLFHPPSPVCPTCTGSDIGHRAVSGRGQVVSFTVNHQCWTPDLEVPFVIAIVELEEQAGLRFTTNIVDCPVDRVCIGMPVRVVFENVEDVWVPLFREDA